MNEKNLTELVAMNFWENVTALFCFAVEKEVQGFISLENLNLCVIGQFYAISKEMV